ncbi:flagellar assembly protein FliW [Desulfocurvus sp. DL9XJH121]
MAQREVENTIQTRLGELSVDMDRVIRFPRGIIGFEECKNFTLLHLRDNSPFLMLQSMDRPELGLMVADPYTFLADYKVKIGSAEQKILQLDNVREIAVLVTVSIPPGKPEETSLNLMGPIIVNSRSRVGLQVPQVDAQYPSRYPVGEGAKKAAEALAQD